MAGGEEKGRCGCANLGPTRRMRWGDGLGDRSRREAVSERGLCRERAVGFGGRVFVSLAVEA